MQYTDFNWTSECFLVADDDFYSHLLLEKVLLKTGAKVVHAYNGAEAINILKENKEISIALIDIVMPVYNGFDVIEQTINICPNVNYFAYTADVLRVSEKKCQEMGFLRRFGKPMLPVRLFKEISEAIPVRQVHK